MYLRIRTLKTIFFRIYFYSPNTYQVLNAKFFNFETNSIKLIFVQNYFPNLMIHIAFKFLTVIQYKTQLQKYTFDLRKM